MQSHCWLLGGLGESQFGAQFIGQALRVILLQMFSTQNQLREIKSIEGFIETYSYRFSLFHVLNYGPQLVTPKLLIIGILFTSRQNINAPILILTQKVSKYLWFSANLFLSERFESNLQHYHKIVTIVA